MSVSPWWWVALAILLGVAEMLTPTTVLVWSAAAAAVTAAALWLAPGLGLSAQIALFALLSIAFIFVGRAIFVRRLQPDDRSMLNRRADQVVGRDAVVLAFDHGDGQGTVDGVPWPARLEPGMPVPEAGDRVLVTVADGIVVRVLPIRPPPRGNGKAPARGARPLA